VDAGTGFVAALPQDDAGGVAAETDGRVIGHVEEGEECVAGRGLELS
jgi:phosphoribosylformylglycinamidine cyclo-ligase